ncbi:GP88 family protein [Draconibacterium aestuarii]|uniref:GP88 family protein n=1 Tax=Draconibacterium aestuarii TaxID=2998507 RepID=UPI003CCFF1A2
MFLSFGNLKLPSTTAIFNITSANDCPAKKFCNHVAHCYARKTEKRYPGVLPYRRKQTELFDLLNGEQLAKLFLLEICTKKHHISKFRFSESGDFRTQSDVDKLTIVSEILKNNSLVVYGYTARPDLDFHSLSKVATVNGNHFKVTNEIRVVTQFSNSGEIQCKNNCRICDACATASDKTIEIIKH